MTDPHVHINTKELDLYFKFDGKERIYQFKYNSSNPEILNFLSSNYDFFLNLDVTNKKQMFDESYLDTPSPDTLSFILRSFDLGFKSYIGDPGSLVNQDSSIDTDILCHCSKVSSKSFEREFIKNRGDAKKTVFETMVKSFCDSCNFNVDAKIKELEKTNEFFMGEDKKIWEEKINSLIEDFYLFCPAEYSSLKFQLSALKYDKVIIKCDKGDSKLTRKEIQGTLSNYLLDEFDKKVVISVIT